MEFCNLCGNIFYIRKKDENNKLEYYCKNCDNFTDYNSNICVYERKMNNDFYLDNIINNKWIVKDPTLPVLSNINCINNNCIINNYYDNSVIIYNDDQNIINEIYNLMKEYINEPIKLNNKFLIIFKDKDNYDKYYNNLNKLCKNKKIELIKNVKNQNKVTFVKYQNDDMSFLYICNYCNRSWKNN